MWLPCGPSRPLAWEVGSLTLTAAVAQFSRGPARLDSASGGGGNRPLSRRRPPAARRPPSAD